MSTALDALMTHWSQEDPFAYDPEAILDDQLAAAEDLFRARREQIPVLDRRATDEGIDAIERPGDLIPLLFSHTTYKSYPDVFIRTGRWDRLCAWLETLSTYPVRDLDLDGVHDIDDWVARLHDAGHWVMTTSGTTGRTSFVNLTQADKDTLLMGYLAGVVSVSGGEAGPTRTGFLSVPRGLTNVAQLSLISLATKLAPGGEIIHLTDEPLRAAEIARMGRLRTAIAKGEASPVEIEQAEREATERGSKSAEQVGRFVEQILERHDEPLFIGGSYGLLWTIVRIARAHGLEQGSFHPDTILFGGGGLKGIDAPPDFLDQIREFFGPEITRAEAYGMSEFNTNFPRCSAGHYHTPPTTLPLILDKAGERLLNQPEGIVEGRMAGVDLTVEGRWSGVISGDRVTVQFGPCACGRRSPAIRAITRYSDLPEGDDKLSCAGTIDSYVRGSIGAAWA